jgi:hypothetical protein
MQGEKPMKIYSPILFIVLIAIMGVAGCSTPAAQVSTPSVPLTTQLPPTQLPPTQPPPAQPPATQIPPAQPPASQETPQSALNIDVVLNMVERLNAGDVDGSLAYFADDATVYLMGFPPTGIEVYKGKEQIRSVWQDSADSHFEWDVYVTSAMHDLVNVQSKTSHDFTRQLGVAPLEYVDVYEVIDGKIKTYGSWLTEESLARFKPALAAVMPPDPTATPPTDPAVSEMTVTIADGTCTTDSPMNLQAGEIKVTVDVKDTGKTMYAVSFFKLNLGRDILDLMVASVGDKPYWADMPFIEAIGPGQSDTYTMTLEEGPVYMVCWSKPPDLPIGNAGPFIVTP